MRTLFEQDIYRRVVLYAAQAGTKKFAPGKRRVSIEDKGNKLGENGTGGVLVVDVDTKNGGSVEALARAFPGVAEKETVVVSTPSGGVHLVYSLSEEQDGKIRTRTGTHELVKGVEVPPQYLVPGSSITRDDGTKHSYTIGEVVTPAPCPPDVWAVVADDGDDVEIHTPTSNGDYGGDVEYWLDHWANSGAGEHNDAFTAVAFRIFHALGVDEGIKALEENDPGWDNLQYALSSAVSAFKKSEGGGRSFTVHAPSRTRRAVLDMLMYNAVLGKWDGGGAANDRRVFLQLLDRAVGCSELVIDYPRETIATHTGIKPESVATSLDRLEEQGRIARCFPDKPHRINLTCSVLGGLYIFKLDTSPKEVSTVEDYSFKSTVSPLSTLWRCKGLTGRHSHVFALIDNGVSTNAELARRSGCSKSTVSDCVKALNEFGLITDGLTIAPGVDSSLVHRLCVEHSGYESVISVGRAITEDHERRDLDRLNKRRAKEEQAEFGMPYEDYRIHLNQAGLEG